MDDTKKSWSSAHAQLWTSIDPPQAPARTPPKAPAPTEVSPARELVDVSALTVNNDISLMSIPGGERDHSVTDLRAQLRLVKRELASMYNQRSRDSHALAALAKEVRRSASMDISDVGNALGFSITSPAKHDQETLESLQDLVGSIAELNKKVRHLKTQVSDFRDEEAQRHDSIINEQSHFASQCRAQALRVAYGMAPQLPSWLSSGGPGVDENEQLSGLLRHIEEQSTSTSHIISELMFRFYDVERTDIPETMMERTEKLYALSASNRREQQNGTVDPASPPKQGSSPKSASATSPGTGQLSSVCEAELRRVIDILGGDGDAVEPENLAAAASSAALRVTKEKESASREASIASLSLVEYEKQTRHLLRRLGVSDAPDGVVIKEQLSLCASGGQVDPSERAKQANADEILTRNCGWIQHLTRNGERLFDQLDLPLPPRQQNLPPVDTATADHSQAYADRQRHDSEGVRHAHEKMWHSMQDHIAALLNENRTLRVAAMNATNLAERIVGVPESSHADPSSLQALESKAADLRGFDSNVLQRLRRLIPLLPTLTDPNSSDIMDDPNVSLTDVLDGVTAALRVNTALGDAKDLDINVVSRALGKLDGLLTAANADWESILGSCDLLKDTTEFIPKDSNTLDEAVSRLEQRVRQVGTALIPLLGECQTTASGTSQAVQKIVLQLGRLITATGAVTPSSSAPTNNSEDLVQMLDARIVEMKTQLGKTTKGEQNQRSERSKLETMLLTKAGPIVEQLHKALEKKGDAPMHTCTTPGTSKSFTETFEPLLNAVSTLCSEAAQKLTRQSSALKEERVRVENYADNQQVMQKRQKKATLEAVKICNALGINTLDETGKTRDASVLLPEVLESLADNKDVDVKKLAAELQQVKEESAEKDLTLQESLAIVLHHFAVVSKSLKESLMLFSASESTPDDIVLAASEEGRTFTDEQVEDMTRHTMSCAKRYALRLEKFTVDHFQTMQKVATYHQAMHQTITKSRSEKHDATINDINDCMLRYADDILLALHNKDDLDAPLSATRSSTSSIPSPSRAGSVGAVTHGPDHRLVRVLEKVTALHNTLSGMQRVRYLQFPDEVAKNTAVPSSEGPDEFFDVTGTSMATFTTDDVIRMLEKNLANIGKRLNDFSSCYKSAAIILEKDIDLVQRELDTAICAIRDVPLEKYFPVDKGQLQEIHQVLGDKAGQRGCYFFNRTEGAGVCPWGLAAKHVSAAVQDLGDVAVHRADSARHFKTLIEQSIDPIVDYLSWRGTSDIEVVNDKDVPDLIKKLVDELQELHGGQDGGAKSTVPALEEEVHRLTEQLQLEKESHAVTTQRIEQETDTAGEALRVLRAERDAALSEAAMARAKLSRKLSQHQEEIEALAAAKHRFTVSPPNAQQKGSNELNALQAEYGNAISEEIPLRHLYSPERRKGSKAGTRAPVPTSAAKQRAEGLHRTSSSKRATSPITSIAPPVQRTPSTSTLMTPTASSRAHTQREGAQTARPARKKPTVRVASPAATPAAQTPVQKSRATTDAISYLRSQSDVASSANKWIDIQAGSSAKGPSWRGQSPSQGRRSSDVSSGARGATVVDVQMSRKGGSAAVSPGFR